MLAKRVDAGAVDGLQARSGVWLCSGVIRLWPDASGGAGVHEDPSAADTVFNMRPLVRGFGVVDVEGDVAELGHR